jgi:hypothetical protein
MNAWLNLVQRVTINNISGPQDLAYKLAALMYSDSMEKRATVYNRSAYGYLKAGKNIDDFVSIFRGKDCYKAANDKCQDLLIGMSETCPFIVLINVGKQEEGYYTFEIYTTNLELMERFIKSGEEFFEEKTDNAVHMLVHTSCGYSFTKIGDLKYPLVRENYEDKIVEGFDYIVNNLTNNNPLGKLVILSGNPGTGKTFFIKGLIDAISKRSMCVILPAQLITELDGPSLVPVLLEHKYNGRWDLDDDCCDNPVGVNDDSSPKSATKPIVFIAEDCDHYLVPREGANSSLISGLLNYTDGIMSDMLNIRFIATTNAPHLMIDAALKRPGRLLKHCFVGNLPVDQANDIYSRLTNGEGTEFFDEEVSLAEIYARVSGAELYDETLAEPEKRLGFGA